MTLNMPKNKPTDQIPTRIYLKELFKTYISPSNSVLVSLIVLSTYLLWFTAGLVFGGAFANFVSPATATLSGWAATIITFVLGSVVIYNSIFKHHPIIILSVITMMGANISYSLGLFTIPVIDFLFDIATIFTMLVLYCFSSNDHCLHLHREQKK